MFCSFASFLDEPRQPAIRLVLLPPADRRRPALRRTSARDRDRARDARDESPAPQRPGARAARAAAGRAGPGRESAATPPRPRRGATRAGACSASRAERLPLNVRVPHRHRHLVRAPRVVFRLGAFVDAAERRPARRARDTPRAPRPTSHSACDITAASETRSCRLCSSTPSISDASPVRRNWK